MTEEPGDADWVTIDQLANSSGVTVRNLRAYQARGLLPPPQVRARTGYYGPEHWARLELIKDLQAEGVKLETIKKLFAATDGSTEQVLQFIRTLRRVFGEPERTIVSRSELAERFGTGDEALLKRGIKLGLLAPVSEDQFEEVLPQLSRIGQSLVDLGISLERSLEVVDQLRRHAEGIAKVYVEVFLDEVWEPFESSGRPDDQWPRLHATIEQLQKISGEALLAVLGLAVSERLDLTFGKDIAQTVRTARGDAQRSSSDQPHP
jgi:DNA-binding transcriptional MerR regulator